MFDLFGIERFITPKGKPMSERAGLIKYFVEELGKEPKVVGIRLAHYSLQDLYYLKSSVSDIVRRNGMTAGSKYFWWATRTEKIAPE